jgi:hypothetical protein
VLYSGDLFAGLGPYPYWKGKASVDWVPMKVHEGVLLVMAYFSLAWASVLGAVWLTES